PQVLASGMVGAAFGTSALFAIGRLVANGHGSCRGVLCGIITPGSIQYIMLAVGIGWMAYTALYYLSFSFLLTTRNITINSGVVVRDSRTIDFGKIQNVESRRGPLEMLLGLTTLKIWTASMDQISFNRNGSRVRPDGLLTLSTKDAQAIRDHL